MARHAHKQITLPNNTLAINKSDIEQSLHAKLLKMHPKDKTDFGGNRTNDIQGAIVDHQSLI